MRNRKTVFCEFHFLQSFLSQQPKAISPHDDSIREMECWLSLFKFICNSDLYLDITADKFQTNIYRTYEKDLLDYIWKEGHIYYNRGMFPNLESDLNREEILNSVILTSNDASFCDKVSKKYGIIVINETNWKEKEHLYKDNGRAIYDFNQNACIKNWKFLKDIPQLNVCNSLIIIDNYLFDNNTKYDKDKKEEVITLKWEDKLKSNLKPILECIIPQNLSTDIFFEIIIITGQKIESTYESQYETVRNIINELNVDSNIKYKCSFFLCTLDLKTKYPELRFHDRCIVTNNIWISSGYGFGIFDDTKNRVKPTTINVLYPFFQSNIMWCNSAYINIIKGVNEILSTNYEEGINYWGDNYSRTCRIVSHYIPKYEKLAETPKLPGLKIIGDINSICEFKTYNYNLHN